MSALFSHFSSKEADNKQTVYITGKDIVSNLSILEPYNIKYAGAKDDLNFVSHNLSYFLPENVPKVGYLAPTPRAVQRIQKGINIDTYGSDYFKDLQEKRRRYKH